MSITVKHFMWNVGTICPVCDLIATIVVLIASVIVCHFIFSFLFDCIYLVDKGQCMHQCLLFEDVIC